MNKKPPFIISFIAVSDSGKTTLILKLLPELKRKGFKVATAKHCPKGFDLDIQGKDSQRFTSAGAQGTFLSSGKNEAVIRPKSDSCSLKDKLYNFFQDFDIVLTEGYSDEEGINKIQIIRKDIGGNLLNSDDIIAYVSDMNLDTNKPIFKPNDIIGIVTFIENLIKNQNAGVFR